MSRDSITLFLCGDVMTGRGIDQVLLHPVEPVLHEPFVRDAREYVRLAEAAHGPLSRPVDFSYIWGDALDELERVGPDVRIVNLETSVTRSDEFWPGKGIHYRMNPQNVRCLTAAGIDCCGLANNHVLDWGYAGLFETLDSLRGAGIACAGAGRTAAEAEAPAILPTGRNGRVLVLACGSPTSGIPPEWAAASDRPGVNLVAEGSDASVGRIAEQVRRAKEPGDVVVVSIHWGPNWGYEIPAEQRRFAQRLVDEAGADVICGHSSHHVKGIEVYRDRPILYGCGDFLTDYEGITGYEEFRGGLGLMYFADLERSTGRLTGLRMTPTRMQRLRVNRAAPEETQWLTGVLNRTGAELGTRVEPGAGRPLTLQWG